MCEVFKCHFHANFLCWKYKPFFLRKMYRKRLLSIASQVRDVVPYTLFKFVHFAQQLFQRNWILPAGNLCLSLLFHIFLNFPIQDYKLSIHHVLNSQPPSHTTFTSNPLSARNLTTYILQLPKKASIREKHGKTKNVKIQVKRHTSFIS